MIDYATIITDTAAIVSGFIVLMTIVMIAVKSLMFKRF